MQDVENVEEDLESRNQKNLDMLQMGVSIELSRKPNDGYIPTEVVYQRQKEEIQKIKTCLNTNPNTIDLSGKKKNRQRKIFNGNFQCLTLNDHQFFELSKFSYNYSASSDELLPELTNPWNTTDNLLRDRKHMEFRNVALRTVNEVNYETNGIEINLSFKLYGESEFWIITRCFVNKDVNESYKFDSEYVHNTSHDVFNKYSTLIKVIKEKNSNRCFIIFGTFYENDETGRVIYKTFLKRQLVDLGEHNINHYYTDSDSCEVNMIINDLGSDSISTKVALNDKDTYSDIKANFYLPTDKRAKILFCGLGSSVLVNKMMISNFLKDKEEGEISTIFTSDQKSCNCCNIY